MKIEISRSFSRKLQVKQYEPIEMFCSAKMEIENDKVVSGEIMIGASEQLDRFCQSEVEKSAARFKEIDTKKSKDVGQETAELDAE